MEELAPPLADLQKGRWKLWVCTRCLNDERGLPADSRMQIAAMRAGRFPGPGMRADAWPNRCYCGGVLREVEVMVQPGSWSCPDCGEDLGAPDCEALGRLGACEAVTS